MTLFKETLSEKIAVVIIGNKEIIIRCTEKATKSIFCG